MPASQLQGLLSELTREFSAEQPTDVLQYCSDWFHNKLRAERVAHGGNTSIPTSTSSRAQPPTLARKFPNFPTMSLPPQAPANLFATQVTQPSPFSEHGPSESPFGAASLSHRRATMATVGASTGFPGAGHHASTTSPNLHSNPTFGGYSMGGGGGAAGGPTGTQLGQVSEEVDENAPTAAAPFGQFSFNDTSKSNQPGVPSDPSPFQNPGASNTAASFPPQAGSAGVAHATVDELRPPSYALGRRTSVSAESLSPSHGTGINVPSPMDGIAEANTAAGTSSATTAAAAAAAQQPPKTASQLQRIKEAIGANFLFRNLDEEQERDVLAAMREVKVGPGEVVIEQGAAGDYFYVIESGKFNIFKKTGESTGLADGESQEEQKWGSKVHTALPGGSFGELALMYNAPRAATVIAEGEATLWALDRISFRTILLDTTSRKRRMYETFLSSVPILASLQVYERAKIADALESRTYEPGEQIIAEGEAGEEFYLVENGKAIVEKSGMGVIGELSRGDYFGELALLNRAPRAATVRAAETGEQQDEPKLRIAALGEQAFTRLLGPVREIMARKAGEMYGLGGQ